MARIRGLALDRTPGLSLARVTLLGALVGTVGGVGAWIFRLMIGFVHDLAFLGSSSPSYDANQHTADSPLGVFVALVPVVGSVVVVFLVTRFAPEAKGHGVPEVMDAVYYRKGQIRPTVAVVKALASAVSIGTGGSVGREGPIVQIGSAFGSTVGQWTRLSVTDTRLLIAAGSAAGIGATFNAPIGGVLFAVELLLVAVSARSLLVVAVAVASGIFVARPLIGSDLAFSVLELEHVTPLTTNWIEVVGLVIVGLGVGVVSAVFIRGLYGTEDLFDRRFTNPYLAHATGMLGVGITMVVFHAWLGYYTVEGVGYATILDVLTGVLTNPWVLLALVVGKLAVTFLTLGSGASGGVFSPALFVGAALGGLAGHLAVAAGLAVDPVVMALAGMAAMVSGSTGAVMTAVVMTTEMTGDYGAAVPLLLASVVALAMRRRLSRTSIYTEKLHRRGKWVPTGLQAASVDTIRARDLMGELIEVEDAATVDENESIFAVIDSIGSGPLVVTREGSAIGVIDGASVERAIARLESGDQP